MSTTTTQYKGKVPTTEPGSVTMRFQEHNGFWRSIAGLSKRKSLDSAAGEAGPNLDNGERSA